MANTKLFIFNNALKKQYKASNRQAHNLYFSLFKIKLQTLQQWFDVMTGSLKFSAQRFDIRIFFAKFVIELQ